MKKTPMHCVALGLAFASQSHAQSWTYSSYASRHESGQWIDSIVLDLNRGTLRFGHSSQPVVACSRRSQFYCISSAALNFAVPKEGLDTRQFWQHEGRTYVIAGREVVKVMGKPIDVYVISCKVSETREDRFFYSPRKGLLVITTIENSPLRKYSEVSVIQSSKGFPLGG